MAEAAHATPETERQQRPLSAEDTSRTAAAQVQASAAAPPPALLSQRFQGRPGLAPLQTQLLQRLQRTYGNQAVQRVLGRTTAAPSPAPAARHTRPSVQVPAPHAISSQPVALQRYREVAAGDDGYKATAALDGRKMFTEKATKPTVDGATGTIGYATTNPDTPKLKVADDGTIAINATDSEAKEFFAVQEVLDDANKKLTQINSPVELVAGGGSISVGGKTLLKVNPKKRGVDLIAGQFVNFADDVCIQVATNFMGKQTYSTEAVMGGQNVSMHSLGQTSDQIDHLAGTLAGAKGNDVSDEALTAMESKDGVKSVGKEYGTALGKGEVDTTAKKLGINQFARAKSVGEGYATYSIFPEGGGKQDFSELNDRDEPKEREFAWGYHYAAVTAMSQDGKDQVTLENYARKSELQEAQKELIEQIKTDFAGKLAGVIADIEEKNKDNRQNMIGELLHYVRTESRATAEQARTAYAGVMDEKVGQMWFFKMYGDKEGQSFHEQSAKSGYFMNPLTVAVQPSSSKGDRYFFAGAGDTLAGSELNMLRSKAKELRADLTRNPGWKVHVTGYATSGTFYKDTTQKTLAGQRAENVRAEIASIMPDELKGNVLAINGGPTSQFTTGRPDKNAANRCVEVELDQS